MSCLMKYLVHRSDVQTPFCSVYALVEQSTHLNTPNLILEMWHDVGIVIPMLNHVL